MSRFPVESWSQITQYLVAADDNGTALIHCWLDVRCVCKQLRAAVEIVFKNTIFPEIEIEFKVDSRGDYLQGYLERRLCDKRGILKGGTMKLDRFVSDTCAIFKARDFRIEVLYQGAFIEERPCEIEELVKEWRADIELYLGDESKPSGRFELTPHFIKLRGVINDTELSGLVVDYKAREVAFDWTLMLDRLLSEEKLVAHGSSI